MVMSHTNEGKFVLKRKTTFKELEANQVSELPESDLCFQDGQNIYQFKFEKTEETGKLEITPGTFVLTETPSGIDLRHLEFKKRHLLESATNTAKIMGEAKKFFSKLDVYKRLERPLKRGVLLYSNPGMGKTSAIEKVCGDLVAEDPGTVTMVWPTSKIDADDIVKFLSIRSTYSAACTRLALVIEDIGGGEIEGRPSRSGVDSGLLNLLDGIGVVFSLPTFIIATTNHPENLLSSLADRPGRFDLMMKLQPPNHKEKIALMEFICKRELTEAEKDCLGSRGTEDFSIAHLEEVAVRSELDDKTYPEVISEMIKHKELFKRDFEDKEKRMGAGLFGNDD
jgi:SpoVK/Ycf46/Vps4 family AAA+-type ATPase